MLSIIICSISQELLRAVIENIQRTVGIEYEVIVIDNSEKHWPIAKVYNYGAQQANYPYLLFAHEDVRFHSHNWGNFIIQKLAESDCGVVGFAGSKVRLPCYSGWYQFHESIVSYLYQGNCMETSDFQVVNARLDQPFEEVIVVDGLGMFVRRDIWAQYPFDENLLTGFHCYDIDFSLQIANAHYKNYICCSNKLLIEHFSMGNFNSEEWFSATIRLHAKWNHLLPMKIDRFEISDKQQKLYVEKKTYSFLKKILKSNCKHANKRKVFREFCSLPFSWQHFRNFISASFKYLKYILGH